jgi:hypothetical protein
MSANLTLGPSSLLLIRESQLARFRNIDVGPNARLIVLPESLPENWAQQLAQQLATQTQNAAMQSPSPTSDRKPT